MLVNVSCEEDVSPSSSPSPTPPHCPLFWDGFLCWPRTRAGSLAALSCFEELLGVQYDTTQNATLQCQADGSWSNHSDYSRCVERSGAEMTEPAGADSTEVTSLIYLLGYSLSLGALLLAVAVFLYFKDLRCLRNTIHTNLMCTYILFALIWILNLTLQLQVQGSDLSCLLLVIFSHYFLLTNFFWMLVEGLYLYMLVVKTFAGENITLKVYASIGWGAPALFVVTWTVARTLVTIQPDSGELNELSLDKRRGVCLWMREHAVDWIYIGPGVVALVLNLLFLVRVMWVLITKLRSANTLETQRSRKAAKALLVLIPLLGLTYLLVLWGPTHPLIEDIFEHVKATLLSTQGFTVALFYCFLNTEVQNALRHHVGRWQDKRSVQGGRRYTYNYNKDWSPRSRTESLRLYSQPASGYHKRESCTSEVTTSTLVALPAAPTVPNHAETQGEVVCGGSD